MYNYTICAMYIITDIMGFLKQNLNDKTRTKAPLKSLKAS